MATTSADSHEPLTSPPVIDRVLKPKGILPRHAQTWVLLGLASVMIVIIAFTGQSTPQRSSGVIPAPPTAIDPNETRIREYRDRIEEQARRLAVEQSELEVAKRALAQPSQVPPGSTRYGASEADPTAGGLPDAFEHDLRQREYRALFADNLALTLREPPQGVPFAEKTPNRGAQAPAAWEARAPGPLTSTQRPDVPLTSPGNPPPPEEPSRGEEEPAKSRANSVPAAPPTGHERLFEGTIIETVLTTRLDGSFAGPVSCLVTTPVYTRDYQRVLIPRGSRILGSATPVAQLDQKRLVVTFHRLLLPDGRTVPLDRAPALNAVGEAGLHDQVNRHYASLFGATLAIGAIAGLAQVNTRLGYDADWSDAYRQGASSTLSQSSLRILDRFLNRLPTVTIREGHRVKVYLTGDLDLPVYDKRRSASMYTPIR